MREISILKITLLLLHVIPIWNKMGPTHIILESVT
jgi:hypothetical protein